MKSEEYEIMKTHTVSGAKLFKYKQSKFDEIAADVAANGIDSATALTGDLPRTTCTTQTACLYRFNSFSDRTVSNVSSTQSVYQIRLGIRFDF